MMDWMRLAALEVAVWTTAYVSDTLTDTHPHGDFVAAYNRTPLGLSTGKWADLLIELADRKYITFHADGRRRMRPSAPQITPADTEIVAALLLNESDLSYALTPEGGRVWENAARADWLNYLDFGEGYCPRWESMFGSISHEETYDEEPPESDEEDAADSVDDAEVWHDMDLARPQLLLGSQRRDLMEAVYAVDADTLKIVVPGSRQDCELKPWHPTYWKTLPFGHRLGYSVYSPPERQALSLSCPTDAERGQAHAQAPSLYPSWYHSVFPPHRPTSW